MTADVLESRCRARRARRIKDDQNRRWGEGFAVACVALLLLAGAVFASQAYASSGIQGAAFNALRVAETTYVVPLQMKGGAGAVICDAPTTKGSTYHNICAIHLQYAGSICYVDLTITGSSGAHGMVICGRPTPKSKAWGWKARWTFDGSKWHFSNPTRAGRVPWPA